MKTKIITDINELDLSKSYTVADYMSWRFEEMVELIRGKVFKMSPAPSLYHQEVAKNLSFLIESFLRKKPCKLFFAPTDVQLFPEGSGFPKLEQTVLQPDLFVVCDLSKLGKQVCKGAPDWIIEIVSPGTAQKDINEKYHLYEKAGVKEYWIVFPSDKEVITYILDEQGVYIPGKPGSYVENEKVPVHIFPELEVDLKEVFGS